MFGKIIVSICAVSGILLVPLPMAILAKKFTDFYNNEKRKKEITAKYAHDAKIPFTKMSSIEIINNNNKS